MWTRWKSELVAASGVIVLGGLNHFIYEWSGKHPATAWFSATNESVWEHMKLGVWPYTLMAVIMFFVHYYGPTNKVGDHKEDVWFSSALGLVLHIIFIPFIFYLYTQGKEGKSILAVDLTIFFVAVILGHLLSWAFSQQFPAAKLWKWIVGILIYVMTLTLFVTFSYAPPSDNGLFYQY